MKMEVESEEWPHQNLKTKSNKESFTHLTMKVLAYTSEDYGDLDG